LEFFDALLKLGNQLFEFVNSLTERFILGFELLNPKIAWIGIHATSLSPPTIMVTLQVCAVDNDRASKKLP
jgi:hypothetical protein